MVSRSAHGDERGLERKHHGHHADQQQRRHGDVAPAERARRPRAPKQCRTGGQQPETPVQLQKSRGPIEEIAERIAQRDLDVTPGGGQCVAIDVGRVCDGGILEEGADVVPGETAQFVTPGVRAFDASTLTQVVATFQGGALGGGDALAPPDMNAGIGDGDPNQHQHRDQDAECDRCPGLSPECLHEPGEYTWPIARDAARPGQVLGPIARARTALDLTYHGGLFQSDPV